MSLVLSKKSGGDFVPHPETDGLIRAVIVDVTAPKKVQSQFGEREVFKLVYESEIADETGRPFAVWSFPYTPSLNEKANFRKDLKKIRGRDLTADEELHFPVDSLIGLPVQVSYGTADPGCYPGYAQMLYDAVPHANRLLTPVKGGQHYLSDQPDLKAQCCRLMAGWCRTLDQT